MTYSAKMKWIKFLTIFIFSLFFLSFCGLELFFNFKGVTHFGFFSSFFPDLFVAGLLSLATNQILKTFLCDAPNRLNIKVRDHIISIKIEDIKKEIALALFDNFDFMPSTITIKEMPKDKLNVGVYGRADDFNAISVHKINFMVKKIKDTYLNGVFEEWDVVIKSYITVNSKTTFESQNKLRHLKIAKK
jgi:hypothetical protein